MYKVSKKISERRKELGISLDIVSHDTKLSKEYIMWVEEQNFSNFDKLSTALNTIKILGDYLGLNGSNLSKIVERDIKMSQLNNHKKIITKAKNLSKRSPKNFHKVYFKKLKTSLAVFIKILFSKFFISFLAVLGLSAFFVNLFINNTKPPVIFLYEPFETYLENSLSTSTTDTKRRFKGKLEGIGEIKINNKTIPQLPGGFFESEIFPLNQYENRFVFKTRNIFGLEKEIIFTIFRTDLYSLSENKNFVSIITNEFVRFLVVKVDNEIAY
ncbi:hypothetical protein D6810_00530, partial [Candidatus Dojkabacteria bacterium]